MRTLFTRLTLVCFFLLSAHIAHSQLVVDFSMTPEELVNDVLLGGGVEAFNITYTGAQIQRGTFNSDNANVGIASGIILSSGSIEGAMGPNDEMSVTTGTINGPGDDDLTAIANPGNPFFTTNDAAVLEFDFIPTGDTLKFNYVFGSDEYMQYANGSINDAFAFILSGVTVALPAVNIAQIPGLGIPVTLNNVNADNNAEFYVDNGDDDDWLNPTPPPLSTDPFYIQYDGMTVVLQAVHPVICGETYHIKIAIADGSDTILDSGVFLEEGSFASNAVVDVALEVTVGQDDGILYEECGEAVMTFTRASNSNVDLEELVIITYSGTAENGVDYSLLPDTVVFEPGVNQVQLVIDAFEDAGYDPGEVVEMTLFNVAACNGSGLETFFSFTISEVTELEVEGYETYLCYGEELEIGPIVGGGYGHYTYDWNTGATDSSIFVTPLTTTTYEVLVSDTCNLLNQTVQIIVNVSENLLIDAGEDRIVNCTDLTALNVEILSGVPDYTFTWLENGVVLGQDQALNFNTDEETTLTVVVSDGCDNTTEDEVLFVVDNPPITISLPDFVYANCIEGEDITPVVEGGVGGNAYTWTVDGAVISNNLSINYLAEETTWLYFDVIDDCSTTAEDSILIDVSENPPIVFAGDDIEASCVDVHTLFVQVEGGQPEYNYLWTTEEGEVLSDEAVFTYQPEETTTVQVVVTDACGLSGEDELSIFLPDVPLQMSVSPDTAICLGSALALIALAEGGEGGFVYEWSDSNSDNSWIQIQPLSSQSYTVTATDICGESISQTIDVDVQYVIAQMDVEYITETLVQFTGITTPEECVGCSYLWDFGDGGFSDQLSVEHQYEGLSEYVATFEVTNEIGCSDSYYTVINPPVYLYIPNAFTPNGDGWNDVFRAQGDGISEFEIWIFNRWGEQVFHSKDINEPWLGQFDGGDHYVQNNIYTYLVEYKGVDGTEFKRHGSISMIR